MTQRGKARRKRGSSSPENRRRTREANLARGAAFRWQPGQSGNPGGRPAFKKLSEACREILSSALPNDSSRTYAEAIAEVLARSALRGSVVAASELADRAEGKAHQSVEMTGAQDRLKSLIDALNNARRNPPPAPSPVSAGESEDKDATMLH